MNNQEKHHGLAYFRNLDHLDQCELQFFINTKIPGVGLLREEVKSVRQKRDTVSSLLQHTRNKLEWILKEKLVSKDIVNRDRYNANDIPIYVALKRNGKHCAGGDVLISFINNAVKSVKPCTLEVFDQKFVVVINAPYVRELTLPPVLYAYYSIQPSKFRAGFTDIDQSQFFWYKSLDKVVWKRIGKGYSYLLKKEDVDHYIKFVCVPYNKVKLKGPSCEVVSDSVVEVMGKLPTCPFEKRHRHTRHKLDGLRFRVVSYNILAERYTNDNDNYSYCCPKALAIDYRKELILNELIGYNADVICLQEVDSKHYATYFKPKFRDLGYDSVFHKKGNRIPEGLASFFRKSRFRQLDSKHVVLSMEVKRNPYLWDLIRKNDNVKTDFLKQSTSLQVTLLKVKGCRKSLMVANTHLYYHPDADHTRLLQVNVANAYLDVMRDRYQNNCNDISLVFCGDFNSDHYKSLYRYMIEGSIDPQHKDCLRIQSDGKVELYHDFVFESACGTPKYTNYTPDYKGCLDYIFIEADKLRVDSVVPLTGEEELRKHVGLPNEVFPSDHLALVVNLIFTY